MQTTKNFPEESTVTSLRPAPLYRTSRRTSCQTLKQTQPHDSIDPFSEPAVFVVDDDPEMRESLELLLLAEMFKVETFESADAFWDVFHPERLGCVILDLRMPGMDGIALLERLAEHEHGLKVIVVSASANPGKKARAKELGAVDFLPKPYEAKKLMETIRKQLSQLITGGDS